MTPDSGSSRDLLVNRLGIGKYSGKALIIGSASGVRFLAVLVSFMLLTRLLTTEEFGRYQQLWLLISTLLPLLLLGVPQGLNYLLPGQRRERGAAIVWHSYLIMLVLGSSLLLVLVVFPSLFSQLLANPRLNPLLLYAGLYLLFIAPAYCVDTILIIRERTYGLLWLSLFYNGFFVLIVFVWGGAHSLGGIFLGFSVLALCRLAFALVVSGHFYGFPPSFPQLEVFKSLLPYYATLGGVQLLDMLTVSIDKYLVLWFLPGEEGIFAIYSLGAMELPFILLLVDAVSRTLMPEFARLWASGEREEILSLLHRAIKKTHVIISGTFFFFLSTAHLVIPLFFTSRYRATIPIFTIYLFLLPLRSFLNHPFLLASGGQRYLLRGRFIDLVLNVSLGVVLVLLLGYWGPAISTVLATLGHKVYQSIVTRRVLQVSWSQCYPWEAMMRVSLGGLLAGVVSFVLSRALMETPLLSLAVSLAGFLVVYGGWLYRHKQG